MMFVFFVLFVGTIIVGAVSQLLCISMGTLAIVCPAKYLEFANGWRGTRPQPGSMRDAVDRFSLQHPRAVGAITVGVGLPLASVFCNSAMSLYFTVIAIPWL